MSGVSSGIIYNDLRRENQKQPLDFSSYISERTYSQGEPKHVIASSNASKQKKEDLPGTFKKNDKSE